MRIILAGALCLGAIAAGSAFAAQTPPSITPTSIGGAKLGLPASAYEHLLGAPFRSEVVPFGAPFTRLVFTRRRMAVYFRNGFDKGVEVISWNRADRSATAIGPCSSIAQLQTAYAGKVKPMPQNTIKGAVYVYHVGNTLFAANGKPPHPTKRVTAVAVYFPSLFHDPKAVGYAGFFILSTPNC
jgi:hypothetical protein